MATPFFVDITDPLCYKCGLIRLKDLVLYRYRMRSLLIDGSMVCALCWGKTTAQEAE